MLRPNWNNLLASRISQAMLESPATIANTMAAALKPETKEERNSKINNSPNPKIPIYAVALLKIWLRNMMMENAKPAASVKKKPKNVPGV